MIVQPEAIKGQVLCFRDEIQMEYVLPEKIGAEVTNLKCPACGIMYLIPNKQLQGITLKAFIA